MAEVNVAFCVEEASVCDAGYIAVVCDNDVPSTAVIEDPLAAVVDLIVVVVGASVAVIETVVDITKDVFGPATVTVVVVKPVCIGVVGGSVAVVIDVIKRVVVAGDTVVDAVDVVVVVDGNVVVAMFVEPATVFVVVTIGDEDGVDT